MQEATRQRVVFLHSVKQYNLQSVKAKAYACHMSETPNRVMPGTATPPTPTTLYTVGVYCMQTWATGAPMRTFVKTVEVEEASTIVGGCRAIDRAIERCAGKALDGYSPTISPNPAALGWPLS